MTTKQEAAIITPDSKTPATDLDSKIRVWNRSTGKTFNAKISTFETSSLKSGHSEQHEFPVIKTGTVLLKERKSGTRGREDETRLRVAQFEIGSEHLWIPFNWNGEEMKRKRKIEDEEEEEEEEEEEDQDCPPKKRQEFEIQEPDALPLSDDFCHFEFPAPNLMEMAVVETADHHQ